MKKLLIIVMLGFTISGNPNSNNSLNVTHYNFQEVPRLKIIMEILKRVESKNTPTALSPRGRFVGVLQISKIAIAEVNQFFGTNYKHKDAYDVEISEDIFMKIMKRGITVFKQKYNKHPSEEQLVRMWNGGLYNGYNKPSTKKYYVKYLKQKEKYNNKTLTL